MEAGLFFFLKKNSLPIMKLFFKTNKKKILFDTATSSFSRYVDLRGRAKVAKDLWAERMVGRMVRDGN